MSGVRRVSEDYDENPDSEKLLDTVKLIRSLSVVVAIFGIFTFLAVVSYLLHWRADMSGEVLRNAAGSLGYGYARFLICRCFGLGSFAILAVFAALSVRLLKDGSQISVMSYLLKSLLGAFVFSLLFAYIGGFVGEEFAFGG